MGGQFAEVLPTSVPSDLGFGVVFDGTQSKPMLKRVLGFIGFGVQGGAWVWDLGFAIAVQSLESFGHRCASVSSGIVLLKTLGSVLGVFRRSLDPPKAPSMGESTDVRMYSGFAIESTQGLVMGFSLTD